MALASDVITRARDLLLDLSNTGYRWTDAELLRYLSDGQREVCNYFPEANTLTELVQPGVTDVRIDMRTAAANTPIAILRFASQHNELADLEGSELKVVEKHVLDSFDPGWIAYRPVAAAYSATATQPQYYKAVVFDPKDRLSFYLYPRAHPDFGVYVTYTAVPVELAVVGDTLALPDSYIPALVDYTAYRALSKDSVYTGAPTKAKEFNDSFMQKIGVGNAKSEVVAPTNARAPNEH